MGETKFSDWIPIWQAIVMFDLDQIKFFCVNAVQRTDVTYEVNIKLVFVSQRVEGLDIELRNEALAKGNLVWSQFIEICHL